MKSIYQKTKILISPALWPEPFGMIALEAMINGIPCIVSGRGGLPEVVGDAGIIIENPYDIQSWVDNVSVLLKNEALYADLSQRSYKRAELFDFEKQCCRFKALLTQIL